MKFKKKKDRFSDLMVGKEADAEQKSAGGENAPVFEEVASETESESESGPKISFIARMKKAVQAFLENSAKKREERKITRAAGAEQRKIQAEEKRALKEMAKAEKLAAAEKLALTEKTVSEKPVEFAAEISPKTPSENQKAPEKAKTDSQTSPEPALPYEDKDRSPWGVLAAGAWKLAAGTRKRKIISASTTAVAVLAVAGFLLLPLFLGNENHKEIAENASETAHADGTGTASSTAKQAEDEKSLPAAITPKIGDAAEKNPQKSSQAENFSAFSSAPPPDLPGFLDDSVLSAPPREEIPSMMGSTGRPMKESPAIPLPGSAGRQEVESSGRAARTGGADTHFSGLSGMPDFGAAEGISDFPDTTDDFSSGILPEMPGEKTTPKSPGASAKNVDAAAGKKNNQIASAGAGGNSPKPAFSAVKGDDLQDLELISLTSLPQTTDFLDNPQKKHNLAETLAESPMVSASDILAPAGFAPENELSQDTFSGMQTRSAVSSGVREKPVAPGNTVRNVPSAGGEANMYLAATQEDITPVSTVNNGKYALGASEKEDAGNRKVSEDAAYVTRQGDDFTGISQKLYGTGSYAGAIAQYNNMNVASGGLPAGRKLFIPPAVFLQKHYPSLCPPAGAGDGREMLAESKTDKKTSPAASSAVLEKTEYVTRTGDNLPDIAQHTLGSASRWTEIYQLNRDVLQEPFRAITPGTRLRLPGESDPEGIIATRPGDGRY